LEELVGMSADDVGVPPPQMQAGSGYPQ
jgi:hypothetical protein